MPTTIRLSANLHARAKAKARRERTTLTALIIEGLELVLAETPSRRKKVLLPRVSKAKGSLRPGLKAEKLGHYDLLDFEEDVPIEKLR